MSYGGQDAQDARSSQPGTEATSRTEAGDDTEAVPVAASSTTATATASSSRLDLLA